MGNTLLAAGAAVLLASSPTESQDRTYLEIVVYEVANPASFARLRTEAIQNLEHQAGFLWWLPLVGDGGLYADVLAWSTPENAKAAAEMMRSDETYTPFVSGISEIRHFGHYWAGVRAEPLSRMLSTAPLLEIALYTVKDRATHERSQPDVYERLRSRDGLLGGCHLLRDGADDGFGDLLTWKDRASFEETGAALTPLPELAPFFRGVEETHVFALFWVDEPVAPAP